MRNNTRASRDIGSDRRSAQRLREIDPSVSEPRRAESLT
jgi:hypothetical protein